MKAWKSFEREVAKAFGGVRIVRVSYAERKGDIAHNQYSIECKYGLQVPSYLHSVTKPTLLEASGGHYIATKFGDFRSPTRMKIGKFKFLEEGIAQAESYSDLTPVLCVKRPRMRGFVVVVRFKDWQQMKGLSFIEPQEEASKPFLIQERLRRL